MRRKVLFFIMILVTLLLFGCMNKEESTDKIQHSGNDDSNIEDVENENSNEENPNQNLGEEEMQADSNFESLNLDVIPAVPESIEGFINQTVGPHAIAID